MATRWLDVLDETIRTCAARGRADLVLRLRQKRTQLLDPRLRVLVVGRAKQGKSQLVNAIVNAPACAVGDAATTAVPTVVQHAEQPCAALVSSPAGTGAKALGSGTAAVHRVPVPVERVAAGAATRPGGGSVPPGSVHLEVGLPRALLRAGLVLIDSPPLTSGPTEPVDAILPADTVLMVSDARRDLSAAELDFLVEAGRSCAELVLVLTKIDLSARWRLVAAHARERLASAGLSATVLPVSAELRLRAARADDAALNAESGFPALVAYLQRAASAKADRLAPHTAAAVTCAAVEALAASLRDERTASEAGPASALHRLRAVQHQYDELRRQSARWQSALADDIADLASDIEYDLRDRTRRIIRTADEFFETADPEVVWDSFTPWLAENLRLTAEANVTWLVERSHWMATRIAANFAAYRADALPASAFWMPDEVFDSMSELERPEFGRFTLGQKLFTGLRGSYGGVVMFGLLTSLAGLPLINVVSLGAGAVFGGKTLHDEGGSRLHRRQAAARAAVQRHVEDFFLKFSKECRDVTRQVHRALRDHFAALAEQMQENLAEAARAAKLAADTDAVQREHREREIQREYEVLLALHRKAQQLTSGQLDGVAA
jgi:hypothetical protein